MNVKSKNLETRKKFINLLEKLENNETRESGFIGLKNIIKEDEISCENLRIYINSLMNYNTLNLKAKEIIVILFGYISSIYKNNLLDPLDNPMSLNKTLSRIVTHIRVNILKENSYNIHKASSYSILQLFINSSNKTDYEKINEIFIEPFINDIIKNGNLYTKNGCCIFLNDFIYHVCKNLDNTLNTLKIIDIIINKNKFIYQILNKTKIENFPNEFLYESIYNLLYFCYDFITKKDAHLIGLLIEKIIKNLNFLANLINNTENVNVIIKNIKILNIIGIKLNEKDCNKSNISNTKIEQCLLSFVDSRNQKIRVIARDTSKIWNSIKEDKSCINMDNNCNKNELFKKMKKGVEKCKVKDFGHYDNEIMENLKNNIYEKGISSYLNLSKFVLEHTKMKNSEKYDLIKTNKNLNLNFNTNYSPKKKVYEKFDQISKIPNTELEYTEKSKYKSFSEKNIKNKINKNLEVTIPAKTDVNFIDNKINIENDKEIDLFKKLSNKKFIFNKNEIEESFNKAKKNLFHFEKKINTKLYHNENRLAQIKYNIEKNEENIIKSHYNILEETFISKYAKTEGDNEEPYLKTYETVKINSRGDYLELYMEAINFYNCKKYNEAFNLIIDDDLYFLRLLFLSKNNLDEICNKLEPEIFRRVLIKLNKLHKHKILQTILKKK